LVLAHAGQEPPFFYPHSHSYRSPL
jgi:hypothetical protein